MRFFCQEIVNSLYSLSGGNKTNTHKKTIAILVAQGLEPNICQMLYTQAKGTSRLKVDIDTARNHFKFIQKQAYCGCVATVDRLFSLEDKEHVTK